MPISMIITQAGLNSLSQGGTTRIASLGLGTTSYTPTDQATSLRDEIKRLPAAGVTAGSLIKVSVTDDSSASYTCREIGLFDADDVLIAVYSQSATIVQKSATSSALIAIDIAFDNGLAQNIVFGDTDFAFPTANTITAGISRLATLEDANNQIAGAVVDGDVLSGYIDQKSSSSIDQNNDQQLATSAAVFQLKALTEANTAPLATTEEPGISRLATLEDANNQLTGAVVDGGVLSGYIDQKSSSSIDQDNDQQLATSAAIYQLKQLIQKNIYELEKLTPVIPATGRLIIEGAYDPTNNEEQVFNYEVDEDHDETLYDRVIVSHTNGEFIFKVYRVTAGRLPYSDSIEIEPLSSEKFNIPQQNQDSELEMIRLYKLNNELRFQMWSNRYNKTTTNQEFNFQILKD